jgi:hypothetical protein
VLACPDLTSRASGKTPQGLIRLVVLPWTDHSQTLFKAGSLNEIKRWLTRVSPEITKGFFLSGRILGANPNSERCSVFFRS